MKREAVIDVLDETSHNTVSFVSAFIGALLGPMVVLGVLTGLILWVDHFGGVWTWLAILLCLSVAAGTVSSFMELIFVMRLRRNEEWPYSAKAKNGLMAVRVIEVAMFVAVAVFLYRHFTA